MTRLPPVAARAARRDEPPALIARARFRFQARRLSLDAVTGQAGTLVRASTGTAVDSLGTTYTAVHSVPRYESRNRDPDRLPTREALGIRLSTDDLSWPIAYAPATSTIVLLGAEAGTRTTSGAGLVYLGNDAQSGARAYVDATAGARYRARLYNGVDATPAEVELTNAAPTTNDLFALALQLEVSEDDTEMRVRLACDVIGTEGEDVTDWSSWIAKPAAWAAGSKMRVNRLGNAGTQGSLWLAELADEYGILTASEALERL